MKDSFQPDLKQAEKSHEANGNGQRADRDLAKTPVHYASREALVRAAQQHARVAESFIPDANDKELLKG